MTSDLGWPIQPGETAQTGSDRIACQACTQCIKLKEATKHGAAWWKWSNFFENSQAQIFFTDTVKKLLNSGKCKS